MDDEEPEAAHIISIACNKAIEHGMQTTHLEIWSAMEALCKPNPRNTIKFELVRDKHVWGGGSGT